jgi:hypothetical protein
LAIEIRVGTDKECSDRCKSRRPAGAASQQVRIRDQSQNRESARSAPRATNSSMRIKADAFEPPLKISNMVGFRHDLLPT